MRRALNICELDRLLLIIAIPVVFAACGGDDGFDPETASSCERPDGVYTVRYDERTGNCGPISDEVVRLDPSTGETSGDEFQDCDNIYERADNGCSAEVDSICDVYDPATGRFLATRTIVGTTSVVRADGSRLEGTYEISISAGSGLSCRSTYDVTFTRM